MFWVVLVTLFSIVYITFMYIYIDDGKNIFFLTTFGLNSDINHSDHSSFLKGLDILT